MGGHGGLNILPQKRWNVYNFDNREKVRLDEEAAAKEEQLKREQSRRRDTELRIEQLRQARGLSKTSTSTSTAAEAVAQANEKPASEELKTESDSKHINLFEGIRIFDPVEEVREVRRDEEKEKNKRVKKEEVRVVTAEDEKYKLGYGLVGKGVKLPWYMAKPSGDFTDKKKVRDEDDVYGGELEFERRIDGEDRGKKKRKSLEELREERLKREKREKERQRALLGDKSSRDGGFSLRR